MPGFDGTGPRGQGPMTGGGRGFCAVNLSGAGLRRGAGGGFSGGGGRGFRNRFYATGVPGWMRAQVGAQAFGGYGRPLSKEEELSILKVREDYFKDGLASIQARMKDLETEEEAK